MIVLNVCGNLTSDAVEKIVNGTPVLNFQIASNKRYKTASGEVREETTFINCQLWNKPEVKEYLYKGRGLDAMGPLSIRTYTAKDGSERTSLNVRVSFFQLFGRNREAVQTGEIKLTPQQVERMNAENAADETLIPLGLSIGETTDDLPF